MPNRNVSGGGGGAFGFDFGFDCSLVRGSYDPQVTRVAGDFDRRPWRKPGERNFPRKPRLFRSPPESISVSDTVSFRGIDDGDDDDDRLGVDDFLKEKGDMSALVSWMFFSIGGLLNSEN